VSGSIGGGFQKIDLDMTANQNAIVSVVITCYNQEKFISEAIESVLSQTYLSWQCLLVDDGSTDGSSVICQQYAAKDKRIEYIYQSNQGVSAARNKGFLHSKGKYIQFLDGDDFLRPEKLKVQVQFMQENAAVAVTYTNHQHYWQSTGSLAQYQFEVLAGQPLEQLLSGYDRGVSIPIHSALLRRDIWVGDELPFPKEYTHRYEDWVFWVLIALKQARFHFLNQNLAVYRMHEQNFVSRPEELAANAIQATFYITEMIPSRLKGDFQHQRLEFILKRYADQKISVLSKRFLLRQLVSPLIHLSDKVKHKLQHGIRKIRLK
jgi:glycosyltransferase involved in cell wall biosynthesis